VDALSIILHKETAESKGRKILKTLKKEIHRQLFEIAPRRRSAGRSSRARISAPWARTIAKCYGGDISRKRKLLEKQKEGKKRMKNVGNVEIPQAAFMAVLKSGDDVE
jgi:GTP-binding protein LepA